MATSSPSWRSARLHDKQAAGKAAGARRQETAGQALGGADVHTQPYTLDKEAGRKHASHRNYTLAPGPVRAQGEGHSPLSLSLLSCKMGVTDTTLDDEPRSVL